MTKLSLTIVFVGALLMGCGPSAYQTAKMDIQREYSELEQVQNLEMRRQKFEEIKQRETMLEMQAANQDQAYATSHAAYMQAYGNYLSSRRPVRVNVYGVR